MFRHKSTEPHSVQLDHLVHLGVRFDDLDPQLRNMLREYLWRRQDGRCAYCECSVRLDQATRIEHFHPRSLSEMSDASCKRELGTAKTVNVEFYLNNLMLCCMGHEGEVVAEKSSREVLTCDVQKGAEHICATFHNPATSVYPSLVDVDPSGRLRAVHFPAGHAEAQTVVDETLNLNNQFLVQVRRKLYSDLLQRATYLVRSPKNQYKKNHDAWQTLAAQLRARAETELYASVYLSVANQLAKK